MSAPCSEASESGHWTPICAASTRSSRSRGSCFLPRTAYSATKSCWRSDKSWRIGYCPAAEATTDACDTFGELLRQRRRWQNSALAVRLWLWGRLPAYLAGSTRACSTRRDSAPRWLAGPTHRVRSDKSRVRLLLLIFAAASGLSMSKTQPRRPWSAAWSSRPAASHG